ncbi:MAG TPA: hypothetical protein ENG00_01315, partial [Candidatus Aenigmarchaeota archaeon]|nr:hypothetical protein [Candidatus Aenigmarchaeota archaeon]
MNTTSKRLVSVIFITAVITFWVQFMYNNIDSFINTLTRINLFLFTLSFPVLLIAYILVIYNWKILLGVTGKETRFLSAARLWLVPNLAKYIPGTVWMPLARGALGKKENIQLSNTYLAWFLEVYLQIFISLLISVFCITFFHESLNIFSSMILIVILFIFSLLFKNKSIEALSEIITKIKGAKKVERIVSMVRDIDTKALFKPALIYIIIYIIYGFWLYVITLSAGGSETSISFLVFSWALSWVTGFLIIFVPGGIGVREAVLAMLLISAGYTTEIAVTIAFLTRVCFLV